jgi:hypothetical protein
VCNDENFTHRNSSLPKVITIHLKFFIFLESAIEEDNDIHFSRFKGINEQLHELKAAIKLPAACPI